MTDIAQYAVLTLRPYHNRSEHINYGLIVFERVNGVIQMSAHIAAIGRKLKGFAPHVSLDVLRDAGQSHADAINQMRLESVTQALEFLHALNVFCNVNEKDMGCFSYETAAQRTERIDFSLKSLCLSSPSTRLSREPKSRLFMDLKSQFKAVGILAAAGVTFPDHVVVPNYAPEPDADVKVEFALQNGILRVAQTIDLRSDDDLTSHQKQMALSKAFALHFASQIIDKDKIDTWMICAGATSKRAERITNALNNQADHLVHWESTSEMNTFMSSWAKSAGKPIIPLEMH